MGKRLILLAIALALVLQLAGVHAADVTTWSVNIYFKDSGGNTITSVTPNQTFYVFADISGTAVSGTGSTTNVYPIAKLNLPENFRISEPIIINTTAPATVPYYEWEVHFYTLEKTATWYTTTTNQQLAEGTNWTTNWSVIAESAPGIYDLSLSMYDFDISTAGAGTSDSLPALYQGWANRFVKNITVNPLVNISAQTNATLYRRGDSSSDDIYGFVLGDTVMLNGTLLSGGSALSDPGYFYVNGYTSSFGSLDDFTKMQSADNAFANLTENISSTGYPVTNGNFDGDINGWGTANKTCTGTGPICTIIYDGARTNTSDGTGSILFNQSTRNGIFWGYATQQFTISTIPISSRLEFAWNKSRGSVSFTITRHNLSIWLIKPDGTAVSLWFNQSTQGLFPQRFKSESLDITSYLDQSGTYNLTLNASFQTPNTAGAQLYGWFDDVKLTLLFPHFDFTTTASPPPILYTNYVLQIRANASGSEGFNVSVYDPGAGSWKYKGQINGSTARQYNFTLTNEEVGSGTLQVRFLDNITTSDTVQNSLFVDFVRVYANQSDVKLNITLLNPKNRIAAELLNIPYSNGFNTTYKLNSARDTAGVYTAEIKAHSDGVVVGKERVAFTVGAKTSWVQESTLGSNSTLFRNRKRAPPDLYVTCNDCHNKIFRNTSVWYDASKATPAQYTDANQSYHPLRPYPSKNPYWFHVVHAGAGYSPEHNVSRIPSDLAAQTNFGTTRTINPGEINHYYEAERNAEGAWVVEAMGIFGYGRYGENFFWTGTCSMCHLVTKNTDTGGRQVLQKPTCTKGGDEAACHIVERKGAHEVGPTCEACHGNLSAPPSIPLCDKCHAVPIATYFNGTTGSALDNLGNDYTTRTKESDGSLTANVTTDLTNSDEEYLKIRFQPRIREKAAKALHFNVRLSTGATTYRGLVYFLDNRSTQAQEEYTLIGNISSTTLVWVNTTDLIGNASITYAPAKDAGGYYVLKINTSATAGASVFVDYAEMNVKAQDTIYRNDTHKGIACLDCHGHAHNVSKDIYCTTCKGDLLLNTSIHRHDFTATEKREGVNQSRWCMECHGWQHNASAAESRVGNGTSTPEYVVRVPKCANCHNPQVANTSWKRYSYMEVPPWGIRVHGNASEKQRLQGKACDFCHSNQHNITKPNCRTPECHGTSDTPPSGPTAGPWIRYSHGEGTQATPTGGQFQNISCLGCHNNGSLHTVGNNGQASQNKTVPLNTSIHLTQRSILTASSSSYNMTPINISRDNVKVAPDGEVLDVSSVCYKCHDWKTINPTKNYTTAECANCHKNSSTDGKLVIHDATMGVTATIDGEMQSGGPNCLPCHNETGSVATRRINITAFKSSTSVHKNMNKNASWYNNVTSGSGTANQPDDPVVKACWACHTTNGSQPINGTMGDIYSDPWRCEDCHLDSGGRNKTNWSIVNPGSPLPPNLTEHLPAPYNFTYTDVVTNDTWSKAGNTHNDNGTCASCHANDVAFPQSGAITGAYDDVSWRRNVSHYAQNDSLMGPVTGPNNSTNCVYCHGSPSGDSENASKWGNATQPSQTVGWSVMGGATSDPGTCWNCHVDSQNKPQNFHDAEINQGQGGSPNCLSCHDYTGTDTSTPQVNASAIARGVHKNLNNRTGDPGVVEDPSLTQAGGDWRNRLCWACHNNGSVTDSGTMGANKTAPWRCPDCHTVGGSQYQKYNRTGKSSDEFVVVEHFKGGSEISAAASASDNATSCVWCHQNRSRLEMLLPASEVNDPDYIGTPANWNADGVENAYGAEHTGRNFSFSHYGRSRTDLYGEQEGVNSTLCIYCHQNTSTVFPFALDTRKEIYAHTNNTASSTVNVNNSNCYQCHGRGRLHQVSLTKPSTVAWGSSNAYCGPCHNATASGWTTIPKVYGHNESAGWGSPDCSTCHASNTRGGTGALLRVHNATLERPFDGQSYICDRCHQNSSDAYGAPQVYSHTNTTLSWVTVRLNSSTNCGKCHQSGNANFVIGSTLHNSTVLSDPTNTQWSGSNSYCAPCHAEGGISAKTVYNHSKGTSSFDKACSYCHANNSYASTSDPLLKPHNITLVKNTTLTCKGCHTRTVSYSFVNASREFKTHYPGASQANTSKSGWNCENCHNGTQPTTANIDDNRLLHSNRLVINRTWSCNGCHNKSSSRSSPFPPQQGLRLNESWSHSKDGAGRVDPAQCAGSCHAINQSFHLTSQARGDVNLTLWPGWNNRSANCVDCHVGNHSQSSNPSPFYAPFINGTTSSESVHRTVDVKNVDKCYACHTNTTSYGAEPVQVHYVTKPDANCLRCHDAQSGTLASQGLKVVNVTAFNQGVHKDINKDMANTSYIGSEVNKRCWACHQSNGTQPAYKGDIYNDPRRCYSCHNALSKPYGNVSMAKNVSEHFASGADVRAASNATPRQYILGTTDVNSSSCLTCHLQDEMLISASLTGGEGSNANFYHYGKNRSAELKKFRNASNWNLFGYSTSSNLSYTDCVYCHQNTSTAFKGAMNRTAGSASNVSHHNNSANPYCTDCHGYSGFHDADLIIPYKRSNGTGGMFNSSLCINCHGRSDIGAKAPEVHAATRNTTSTLECASCHSNSSEYPDDTVVKQIHGIKILNTSRAFQAWAPSNVRANCTTCHQNPGFRVNGTQVPQIPVSFNHSDNESAGGMWNSTAGGFVGYWRPSKGQYVNACYYCHGNVSYVMHNKTALGRVESIRSGNIVNGSIEGSMWCADCHVPNLTAGSNYLKMNSTYGSAFPSVPPGIWNGSPNWPNYSNQFVPYNHSFVTSSDKAASKCKGCHGRLLPSGEQNMTNFVHDVSRGVAGGPNCLSCHDAANPNALSTKRVNVTALNQSVHRNLNSGANSESGVGGLNKTCWACHDGDGANIGETMGDRYNNPYRCYDCHTAISKPYGNVSMAKNVSEHFASGADVRAASNATSKVYILGTTDANSSSCLTCHLQDEMLIDANLGGYGTDANFYHYGRNRSAQLKKYRNASSLNLFGYSTSNNLSYTDCAYCHMNASNAFKDAMAIDAAYHSQMMNHTNRSTGPFCTDCHGYGGFHGSNLTIPYKNSTQQWGGMTNSSLCRDCHARESQLGGGRINKEEHALNRSLRNASRSDAERIKCVTCHANTTNYTSPASNNIEKQIHGIRYFGQSGSFSAPYTKSAAANCTTCHQDVNIVTLGNLSLPKIPVHFNHSDNESAGYQWINVSQDGVYWNVSENANSQCYYCHAVSNRSAGNKTYILHNATPLGPIQAALDDPAGTGAGNNSVDGSISTSSTWCSSCHFNNATFYSAVMARFDALRLPRPPSNINDTLAALDSKYFNHNGTINNISGTSSYASDSKCKDCHGSLASGATRITAFMHNVAPGQAGGPNCISCHDIGGSAPKNVNVTAIRLGIHAWLNNRTNDPGQNGTTDDWANRVCWACHSNGSIPESGSMGQNKTTPWDCSNCHLAGSSQYGKYDKNGRNTTNVVAYEHTPYSSDVATTRSTCVFCHNKSVRVSNDPYIPSSRANVSHYGTQDELKVGDSQSSTKDCVGCHKETQAESNKWNAIYLPLGKYVKMGTLQASSCWQCHLTTKGMPSRSFHESEIMTTTWKRCSDCH